MKNLSPNDVQKEMQRLYDEWMHAATVHIDQWYKHNLADEFVYISAGGGKATREEMIAIANLSRNSEYKLFDVSGRQYGDVIFAHGHYFGKGDFPDDALVNASMREKYGRGVRLAFSGTWVERDGRLQALHLHTTQTG